MSDLTKLYQIQDLINKYFQNPELNEYIQTLIEEQCYKHE